MVHTRTYRASVNEDLQHLALGVSAHTASHNNFKICASRFVKGEYFSYMNAKNTLCRGKVLKVSGNVVHMKLKNGRSCVIDARQLYNAACESFSSVTRSTRNASENMEANVNSRRKCKHKNAEETEEEIKHTTDDSTNDNANDGANDGVNDDVNDSTNKTDKQERLELYFKKLGRNKVDFGRYRNNKLTYASLLKKHVSYCKYVTKYNYNVPMRFKAFCCFHLIQ